jgi:hypothetical protein
MCGLDFERPLSCDLDGFLGVVDNLPSSEVNASDDTDKTLREKCSFFLKSESFLWDTPISDSSSLVSVADPAMRFDLRLERVIGRKLSEHR